MSQQAEIQAKSVLIRAVTEKDLNACHVLIRELAEFEKAPEEFILSQDQFLIDFRNKHFSAFVAEVDAEIVGMALYYTNYSTWKGLSVYLEDLVVRRSHRRSGIGSRLFEAVAAEAARMNAGRFAWQVLEWNESAISFYKKYPVELDEEWINGKIRNENLHSFIKR